MGNFSDWNHCQKVCVYGGTDGRRGGAACCRGPRHLESAQAFAQQHGIPRCYDSYEALAADPEVEAIYIATPNTLHYENCKLCLEQGKHVLCEKPFTIDPEQAQQLYRLAEEKHLFLIEDHFKYRQAVMEAYPCGHYPVFEGYDHMQYQIRDPKGFAEMLAYIAAHDDMPKLPFIRKCEDPI